MRTTIALRQALWVLVLKDFKGRYRAQALGLFWSLAHPLVMMVTITVAFTFVLRIQIPNFSVFYLIGAVFWLFLGRPSMQLRPGSPARRPVGGTPARPPTSVPRGPVGPDDDPDFLRKL